MEIIIMIIKIKIIMIKINELKEEILKRYRSVKEISTYNRQAVSKLISDKKTKTILTIVNEAIQQLIAKLPLNLSLKNINHLMYAASWVIIDSLKIKIKENTDSNENQKPNWHRKIEKEISCLRHDLPILTEIKNDKYSKKKQQLIKRHNIHDLTNVASIIENSKQKIQVKAQRLERFNKRKSFLCTIKNFGG